MVKFVSYVVVCLKREFKTSHYVFLRGHDENFANRTSVLVKRQLLS